MFRIYLLIISVFNFSYLGNDCAELIDSFTSDTMFYIGLSTFLKITDQIQKPYLQFSPKRWGLITGLRGYLTSAYFTTGFKITVPVFALWSTWALLGLPALISVVPFLTSFAIQLLFETRLEKSNSSSWPLVPLIFEVKIFFNSLIALCWLQHLCFDISKFFMLLFHRFTDYIS